MTRVVVEAGLGPKFGYYHTVDAGTVVGGKEMDREEAEELGYSRCHGCFPLGEEVGREESR